jgi:hypothetical protein
LSKLAAGNASMPVGQQYYEQHLHLQDPTVFGPHAPLVTEKSVIDAQLNALLISNSSNHPGFQQLQKLCTLQGHIAALNNQQQRIWAVDTPLMRLLRRAALWYYYRVMFDPLDQLLALNSSYELLFQLMTPHQQLSCMADVLTVLACPVLQDQRYFGHRLCWSFQKTSGLA